MKFMTCHLICNKSNTTCATGEVGTANPSRTPEYLPDFSWFGVNRSLVSV